MWFFHQWKCHAAPTTSNGGHPNEFEVLICPHQQTVMLRLFAVCVWASGGSWWRAATSVTTSCSCYWCDYIRRDPPRGADTAGAQAEDGSFVSTPSILISSSSSSTFPIPGFEPTLHKNRYTLEPTIPLSPHWPSPSDCGTAVWTTTLDWREGWQKSPWRQCNL